MFISHLYTHIHTHHTPRQSTLSIFCTCREATYTCTMTVLLRHRKLRSDVWVPLSQMWAKWEHDEDEQDCWILLMLILVTPIERVWGAFSVIRDFAPCVWCVSRARVFGGVTPIRLSVIVVASRFIATHYRRAVGWRFRCRCRRRRVFWGLIVRFNPKM